MSFYQIFGDLKNVLEATDNILDCICGTYVKSKTVVASKKRGTLFKQEKVVLPSYPSISKDQFPGILLYYFIL